MIAISAITHPSSTYPPTNMSLIKFVTLIQFLFISSSAAFSHVSPAKVNRRDAFKQIATILASGTVAATVLTSNADPALAFGNKMPLFSRVEKLETANYMGQINKPIYPANVNGVPEKHIPSVSINGNDVEISANHVMTEENYIQFIWLKDTKTNEVVLAKELSPQEDNPMLKAKVPSGVQLTPYLFCKLHGLWKGEPFTVA